MGGFPQGRVVTDVIVVGGGPVGMTAALALAARGVSVLLLERRVGPSDEPKAISLDDESLRLYQWAGIVDRIMPIIVPGTGTMYFGDDGKRLFHARAAAPYRLGYPFKNPFAQPDLERVLYDAIVDCPLIDARFGYEVDRLTQDVEGVTVRAQCAEGAVQLTGRFLIGADGGRSAVRKLNGIQMIGRSFDDVWLVVDTVGDERTERYGMHHGDSSRPHVVIPGLDGRCRYEWRLFPSEAEPDHEPPFELIERLVSRYRPLTPDQVERAVCYRFHALNAERWRNGRVFLAGDAAHMMPPFAGQGLNSGLRDVANVTWKLTEALRSPRGDRFLDSYEIERRPHTQAVIDSSVMLGRVVMATDLRVARWRDAKIRAAMRTRGGRSFFEEMRYRPPYRIDRTTDDTGRITGTQIGQPAAFDFATREATRLDAILGPGWALVGVDLDGEVIQRELASLPDIAVQGVSVPLDDRIVDETPGVRLAIDLDTRLYDEFALERGRLVLLRPDRFVAATWAPGCIGTIAAQLDDWLHAPALTSARTAQPAFADRQ